MKFSVKLIILKLILGLNVAVCQSNLETVTFDLSKGIQPESIPFDCYIKTEFIFDKEDVPLRVGLYEVSVEYPDSNNITTSLIFKNDDLIPLQKISLDKVGEGKYNGIIRPIEPDLDFDLAVIYGFNDHDKKELIKIFSSMHDSTGKNGDTFTLFKSLADRLNKSPYDLPREFFNVSFHPDTSSKKLDLKYFFDTHISSRLDNLINFHYHTFVPYASINDFNSLVSNISKYSNSLLEMSYYGVALRNGNFDSIVDGMTALNIIDGSKNSTKYDFEKRKTNISNSIKIVEKQIVLVELVADIDLSFKDYLVDLKSLLATLKSNENVIDTNLSTINKLIDTYGKDAIESKNALFLYGKWFSSSTSIKLFKPRNGKIITTDFGFVNIVANSRIHGATYIPRPYIGLNLTFRPIDKYKDIDDVEKISGWYRWSIGIGVSIGSIDKFEFSDFYKSMSLMFGTNYRVHEQIRIGGGVAILREKHPNPIIDSPRVEPGLYLVTTLDFEVFDNIPKIIGNIFN